MSLRDTVRSLRHGSLDNALAGSTRLARDIVERRLLDPDAAGDGPGALSRLTRTACLAELAAHEVARLAYVRRDDLPDVVPVNYRLAGEDLLIATGVGPLLQAGERGASMALQLDGLDLVARTGWSVLATGRARQLTSAERTAVPDDLVPVPWARGPRRHVLRLRIEHLEGRRLT